MFSFHLSISCFGNYRIFWPTILYLFIGLDLIFEICNIAVHDHVLLNTKIKWCSIYFVADPKQLGIKSCDVYCCKGFFIGEEEVCENTPFIVIPKTNYLKIPPAFKHAFIWNMHVPFDSCSFSFVNPGGSFRCWCCYCKDGIKKGLELDNHFVSMWPVAFNDWSIFKILRPCRQQWKFLLIPNC